MMWDETQEVSEVEIFHVMCQCNTGMIIKTFFKDYRKQQRGHTFVLCVHCSAHVKGMQRPLFLHVHNGRWYRSSSIAHDCALPPRAAQRAGIERTTFMSATDLECNASKHLFCWCVCNPN